MKEINYFLNKLRMKQLLLLSQRFDIKVEYKNPQKRKRALLMYIKKYLEIQPIECPICLEQIKYHSIISTRCAHLFCDGCLLTHVKIKESCPICRMECSYLYVCGNISSDRIKLIHEILRQTYKEEVNEHVLSLQSMDSFDQIVEYRNNYEYSIKIIKYVLFITLFMVDFVSIVMLVTFISLFVDY